MRLKHLLRLEYGSALPATERTEGEVSVYGSNGPVGTHSSANMRAPAIVVGRKGSHGKVTWAESGGFCIDTALYTDHRFARGDLRYCYYLLQTLGLEERSKDSAVPGLDRGEAYRKPIPTVDLGEQKAIADFLDRETARIDALIEKKERLATLLEERERAELLEAFQGLDAKFWRLRHIGKLRNGAGFPVDLQGDSSAELPFYKVKHLSSHGLDAALAASDDTVTRDIASRLRATVFPAGTIVFAKIGAALLLGRFSKLGVEGCIDNNLAAFVPHVKICFSDYLLLALTQIDVSVMAQPGAVPSLNTQAFYEASIPVPDIEVQRSFVGRRRNVRKKGRAATSRILHSVHGLKAYRSALITAAVTGQIDVSTYGRSGQTDRRLDQIEAEMTS